jgi:hypothetical protein
MSLGLDEKQPASPTAINTKIPLTIAFVDIVILLIFYTIGFSA